MIIKIKQAFKMKQILTCLFLVVGFLSGQSQEVISEGHIKLELTEVKSDDPAMEQQLQMMMGTEMDVHFNAKGSLTTMNMMGGMVKTTALDVKDGDGKLLMDMMGNKMYIPITEADAKEREESGAEVWENVDITYDKTDTKEIAGMECYKMNITAKDGMEGMNLSGYITNAITANANIMQIDTKKFDGFPLELTIGMGPGKLTITTTAFEKTVDASVFDVDTGGYKQMTFKELQDMMGQMGGGGFGF